MAKKYLFTFNVDSSALFQPNAKEFYEKALLEQRSTSHFRPILNIKESTKIGNLDFDDPLQESGCDFVATDSNLTSKLMSPCKLGIGVEMCQFDLEQSFISEWMTPGSNQADFAPADFASHYYRELGRKTSDALETLTWQGDEDNGTGSLSLCNGLFKKFFDDGTIPAAQDIAGATIVDTNVIAEMTKVFNAIPNVLKNRKKDLKWFISSNVADAYRLAVAKQSAEMYTTKDTELTFLGIPLTVGEGMFDDTMCLSLQTNYIFLADLLSDPEDVITINMKETTGDRKIRTIADFKFGVDFLNPTEWVVYGNPIVA